MDIATAQERESANNLELSEAPFGYDHFGVL
jgi:hypothetical protein